jgi:hypothetical protein
LKHKTPLIICLAFTSVFLFAGKKGNKGSDNTNYTSLEGLNPNLYGSNPNLYDLTEVSGQAHGNIATKQVEKII